MNNKPQINESFICKIWEGGELFYRNLKANTGEDVKVLKLGTRNYDSGPDYTGAKIQIGNKIMAGDVEIHRDFSGWIDHKHKGDRSYYSVILQVVLWDEGEGNPRVKASREIPTVILSKHLTKSIRAIWQEIISNPETGFRMPCIDYNRGIDTVKLKSFLNKLSFERLSLRYKRIKERLDELIFDDTGDNKTEACLHKSKYWSQALYEFIFEALGFSKNKEPMLKLGMSLPLKKISSLISSEKNKLYSIQALLLGCSGFLNEIKSGSGYPFEIKQKWISLSNDMLKPALNKSEWKFFHQRPVNFPPRRIAYGSYVVYNLLFDDMFKKMIGAFKGDDFHQPACGKFIKSYFMSPYDEFWNNHYGFGSKTSCKYRMVGIERINDILSNVIIPFVFLYSRVFNDEKLGKNVLSFFTSFKLSPAVHNRSSLHIINEQLLMERKIPIGTPAIEQAVTQLYNFYCLRGRCDDCVIGTNIVKDRGYDYRIIFY